MNERYHYLEAVNPDDGKLLTVKISDSRMRHVAKRGVGATLEMAYTLAEALTKPKAIFEGLREDEDEKFTSHHSPGWRGYVSMPSRAFLSNGDVVKPWKEQVFLAYLNDDSTVYNWRWETADSTNLCLPEGYQDRFKKRVL